MNKWQIMCPVVFLAVVAVLMVHRQRVKESRAVKSAVFQQIEGHSPGIAILLATLSTNEASAIEDATYLELQRVPSTSLTTRSDVRVRRIGDGHLQCVIDTSRWGVPPRTIRQPSR